jgi:hypothetical protein
VLNELGRTEKIEELSTIRSNPSFTIRRTSLSLVAIRQKVTDEGNRVRELPGFGVSGIARFQSVYGTPDAAETGGAEKFDNYLKSAWEHVEDIQVLGPERDWRRNQKYPRWSWTPDLGAGTHEKRGQGNG